MIGNNVRVKVVKNKLAPPLKEAYVSIIFGKGIDHWGDLVDMAVEKEIIERNGAWFKYLGESIGQGKAGVVEYLMKNKEVADIIEAELRKGLT